MGRICRAAVSRIKVITPCSKWRTAANLKKEGVKAGVPDIVLPVPRGAYHGLYIELKVGRNKTSLKQKEWISMLKEQGYFVEVCYGWIAAKEVIENYLKGLVK